MPVDGSRFEVALDTVVRAVGQAGPTERSWPRSASRCATASPLADAATGRTSNPKVWAIGDIVNGGAEVVNAVQAGKLAARSIVDALGLGGPRIVARRRPTPPSRASTCSPTWPASAARTRSGWRPARSPTPARWSPGRSTRAGAAWSGRPSASRSRNVTVPPRLARRRRPADRRPVNNIELISDRPTEVNFAEIARGQEAATRTRRWWSSLMVESKREAWHDIVGQVQRHRRRRHRAQLRLPARDERARHGRRGRPGPRVRPDDHRVGDGEGRRPGPREADAERHRHPAARLARPRAAERGRHRPDQHDQLADRRQPRHLGARSRTSGARAATAATPARRSSRSRST